MLRFLLYAAIAYLLYRLIKGVLGSQGATRKGRDNGVIDEMVQDPMCKTYVPRREAFRKFIAGNEILFCSKECAERFESGKRG